MHVNLDTHILIFALTGSLRPKEREILSKYQWSISNIVLWEIATLCRKKRITIDLADSEISSTLSRIYSWPITLDICRAMNNLDFQSDPADELIAATSLAHNIPLLTRDKKILSSKRVVCL